MTLSVDEYSKLSPDAQREYDNKERQRERSEQEGLPYRWNQMLDHVEVSIPLPPDVRARQIQVVFKPAWISVKMREECIVEGSLFKPIQPDGCTWTIDDAKVLSVHLEKLNQNEWWPHVVTHHPKIDTTKIVPEESKLSDLDGETRAMVEKMMIENRQKVQNH